MELEIKNGALAARISNSGAQPVSLALGGVEYLWPGGAEWPWRAPVCCPYCGAVAGDSFEHGGVKYAAPRHGFVRDRVHRVVERGETAVTFALSVEPGDARWPWPFELTARFAALPYSLAVTYSVTNSGREAMPLQLGFHPGFLAPAGSAIVSEKPDLGGKTRLEVTPGLFDAGSVDLERPASGWFRLERPDGKSVTVDARGFGWFLLWGAPGLTPFVCLEPWCGYPGDGGLFERPGVLALSPGEVFEKTLKIVLK